MYSGYSSTEISCSNNNIIELFRLLLPHGFHFHFPSSVYKFFQEAKKWSICRESRSVISTNCIKRYKQSMGRRKIGSYIWNGILQRILTIIHFPFSILNFIFYKLCELSSSSTLCNEEKELKTNLMYIYIYI